MAIQHVQGVVGTMGSSAATSAAATGSVVGAGNMVVGALIYNAASGSNKLSSITDDQGNTYNIRQTIGAGPFFVSFDLSNIANGPKTITANFSSAVPFPQVEWDEYSGVAGVDGFTGQTQNAVGTGTDAVSSGALTPNNNQDVEWGATINTTGTSSPTVGTGFTLREQDATSGDWNLTSEDKIPAGSASTAVTFTAATTGLNWITLAVLLTPIPPPHPRRQKRPGPPRRSIRRHRGIAGAIATPPVISHLWVPTRRHPKRPMALRKRRLPRKLAAVLDGYNSQWYPRPRKQKRPIPPRRPRRLRRIAAALATPPAINTTFFPHKRRPRPVWRAPLRHRRYQATAPLAPVPPKVTTFLPKPKSKPHRGTPLRFHRHIFKPAGIFAPSPYIPLPPPPPNPPGGTRGTTTRGGQGVPFSIPTNAPTDPLQVVQAFSGLLGNLNNWIAQASAAINTPSISVYTVGTLPAIARPGQVALVTDAPPGQRLRIFWAGSWIIP